MGAFLRIVSMAKPYKVTIRYKSSRPRKIKPKGTLVFSGAFLRIVSMAEPYKVTIRYKSSRPRKIKPKGTLVFSGTFFVLDSMVFSLHCCKKKYAYENEPTAKLEYVMTEKLVFERLP